MTGHRITARRGYDREELNADNRRKVMDAWKRFESSKPGVWLSRHTDLLERLSDEESHLVARVGAMVCGWAFTSLGSPLVAQRVWPMPTVASGIGLRSMSSTRFFKRPAFLRTTTLSMPGAVSATPAES